MRFKPENLGLLVRPRILASACIVPIDLISTNVPLKVPWNRPKKSEHLSLFKQKPPELFSGVSLGDTSVNLSNAYTGQVVYYLIKISNTIMLVDRTNVHETLKKVRAMCGIRSNLKIISVGVKFFQGMTLNEGMLQPINPWCPKTENDQEVIWFYRPWELVPTTEILKYESVKPAGLGARDMLRLEVGYSLYGHELDQNTSVLESGLKRFIDFDKEFIGKDALLQQIKEGTKRKLAGFISASRRSPRAEQIIYSAQGNAIGRVTSGSFSPAVNAGIGLGFIETPHAVKGEVVFFGDEKNRTEAKISDKIFYTQGSIRA
jgi:hypothetical protein